MNAVDPRWIAPALLLLAACSCQSEHWIGEELPVEPPPLCRKPEDVPDGGEQRPTCQAWRLESSQSLNVKYGPTDEAPLVVDLNLDGRVDLITPEAGRGDFMAYFGNGNGTFAYSVPYDGLGPADAIVVGLISDDDFPDVVVGRRDGDTLKALLGAPPGKLLGLSALSLPGQGLRALALADVDGDGAVDLLAASASRGVEVLLGVGDGSFGAAQVAAGVVFPGALLPGQLNDDGRVDLVVLDRGEALILLGRGDGTFLTTARYGVASGFDALTTAHLNGDAHLDLLAVSTAGGTLHLFHGAGDGSFVAGAVVSTGASPSGLAVGDLDGDGALDAVVTGEQAEVRVLRGTGAGDFHPPVAFIPATPGTYLLGPPAVGDFNRDGRTDVVVPSMAPAVIGGALETFLSRCGE